MMVFLIGFMGAGKTTLGKATAKQLHYRFIDLDQLIEEQERCSISELFTRTGEAGFRQAEQQALFDAVAQSADSDTIIACGGGAPCYGNNLAFMKRHGFVIYLEVPFSTLCQRLLQTSGNKRPLLSQNINDLFNQRKPIYESAHWKC